MPIHIFSNGRPRRVNGLGVFSLVIAAVVGLALALVALVTFGLVRGLAGMFAPGLGGRRRAADMPGAGEAGRVAGTSTGDARIDTAAPMASAAPDAAAAEGSDAPRRPRERSYAEVVEALPLVIGVLAMLLVASPAHAKWLVPMDDKQDDHLRAYGLTFWALQQGAKCEWLLNYRGGSFLLPDGDAVEHEANVRGVSMEKMGGAAEAVMRAEIADNNMEAIALEKVPKVAVYLPANTPPWDDAVTLALQYAGIPYATIWDEEVLRGDLSKYDWLHLHHEDFTGQHSKFYAAYHTFPWYREEESVQSAMARKLGFAKVTQLKASVAVAIKDWVSKGGFMFAMCSATDTYDIALAAQGVDIADYVYDGDAADPLADSKLDYSRTMAFKDFHLEMEPMVDRFSDIDVKLEASQRGPRTVFTLFDFSAKNDPVPSMLVQDHVAGVPEFLGLTTGYHRSKIRSGVLALAEVEGTDEVKYLHGQYGRGTFTFLGGHDPEDYQHMVGDPPTELSKYKHSPGYRLILNNVLFPAAEKKKQRT